MPININEFGNALIGQEEKALLERVVQRKNVFRYADSDSLTSRCERQIESNLAVKNALLVSNGTGGLRAALFALGVVRGDVVLVNAYTFIASASAILSMGATPIPIDFDETDNMNITQVEEAIRRFQPKVIMPVHWPGVCFNLKRILEISLRYHISVLEDACQSFGSKSEDGYSGTIGNIGVYSFQQNKQVSSGEGGCIVTNDSCLMERAMRFVDHGAQRKSDGFPQWIEPDYGENIRANELQAALLLPQLCNLDQMVAKQRNIKRQLEKTLQQCGVKEFVSCEHDSGMNFRILNSSLEEKEIMMKRANEKGVLLKPLWNRSIDRYPVLKGQKQFSLPEANKLAERLLILPISPSLSDSKVQRLIEVLPSIFTNDK